MNKKIFLSNSGIDNDFIIDRKTFSLNNINLFESKIESFFGGEKKSVALNSGTSAIHLALILSKISEGDIVLCQSATFSASVNPIIYQKAIPVFVDSEKDTWNMCPNYLEKAIKTILALGKKPKAIIVVHLYGMPAKIEAISLIAKKYGIILIEDAAEALGAVYKGHKCGVFGDFGILSFNSNKIITTTGGGALICRNQDDKNRAIFFSTQARDKAPHYQHSEIGYNYRMSNVLAWIGKIQLNLLNKRIKARREMNFFYKNIFKAVEGIYVHTEPNSNYFSNHWLTCVLINEKKTGFSREDLRLQLEKDNIESRPLWKPMHMQPVFKNYKYFGDKVSENLFNIGLCLPSGSNITNKDRERIYVSINKLL